MAKGDTKTNQYLDIAANGTRADLPTDTCCETRTQTLIRGVAERIMDVEDEVEEIKNNPDVVDIVATYADLQAYDTQHLTDKDIIRVLQDETHDGESTYYRYNKQSDTWTYVGESKQYEDFVGTDGTTTGEAGLVPAPVATDAGKFLCASGLWETIQTGGGVIELTTADYNYPTDNPTSVALWLLDSGVYSFSEVMNFSYVTAGSVAFGSGTILMVSKDSSNTSYVLVNTNHDIYAGKVTNAGEWSDATKTFLNNTDILQSTGTSTTSVMSQKAVTSMVFADPSTNQTIRIGTSTVQSSGSSSVMIGHRSQCTGQLATSLGPTTSADGFRSIAIGGSTAGKDFSIALGDGSGSYANKAITIGNESVIPATGIGSIALGAYSRAEMRGEMNVGSSNTDFGYNNSNYRLLTGLYDPQSDHDAATKGYVDGLISALEARIAALEGN